MIDKKFRFERLNVILTDLATCAEECRRLEDLTEEERSYITLLQAVGEQGQDKMKLILMDSKLDKLKELGGME